jgi:hypothetical protein
MMTSPATVSECLIGVEKRMSDMLSAEKRIFETYFCSQREDTPPMQECEAALDNQNCQLFKSIDCKRFRYDI